MLLTSSNVLSSSPGYGVAVIWLSLFVYLNDLLGIFSRDILAKAFKFGCTVVLKL